MVTRMSQTHDNVPKGETEVMPDKDVKLEDTKKQKGRLPLSDINPINEPESANEVKHEKTSDGSDEEDWEDMNDEGYYGFDSDKYGAPELFMADSSDREVAEIVYGDEVGFVPDFFSDGNYLRR